MTTKQDNFNYETVQFNDDGLVSVIAQDYESGEVLLLSVMNAEAVKLTFETGYAHYYDLAKKTVQKYGEVGGNTQKLGSAFLSEDGKTLLIKVRQHGFALPEKKSFTRFPTQIKGEYKDIGGEMFGRLQRIVREYKKNPEDGAYTSFLFARGVDRIGKKVGEEAVELVIASKNESKEGVINEAADLLYHTMVLLSARDVKLSEVCAELCKRNR